MPTNSQQLSTPTLQHHHHQYQHSIPNHFINSNKSMLSTRDSSFNPYILFIHQLNYPLSITPKTKPNFNDLTKQQGVWTKERMKQYYPLYPGIDNKKHSPKLYPFFFIL